MSSNWFIRNWFLIGLFLSVLLAWIVPQGGATGGWLPTEWMTRIGVVGIFFFQGVTLVSEQALKGLVRWRLHLLIQVYIFLVTPLLAIAFSAIASRTLTSDIAIGFVFLGALPTTISSALVFTTLARGNVTLALFNTTLSNVVGVILTPLWISIFVRAQGEVLALGSVFLEIALLIVLPMVVGQVMRPRLHRWADANKELFSVLSRYIVLFIVYTSFCNSVVSGFWSELGLAVSLGSLILVTVYFGAVTLLVFIGIRGARLAPADASAVMFCASQKTLSAGVPIAKIVFASNPAVGLILLPVMLYHPVQLLVGGFMVEWYKKRSNTNEKERQD
jgi:sodium/bile acid cotransporter 7